MLSIAKEKMPNATLLQWDITNGLPPNLYTNAFDYIISTYTLHRLNEEEKVSFLISLFPYLKEDGKIIIGDISFETTADLEQCQIQNKHHWDEDEFYFIQKTFVSTLPPLYSLSYKQISNCAGVYEQKKVGKA